MYRFGEGGKQKKKGARSFCCSHCGIFLLLFHNYVLAATCIYSGICLLNPKKESSEREEEESEMNVCYVK